MQAHLVPHAQAFHRSVMTPGRSSYSFMLACELLNAAGHEIPAVTLDLSSEVRATASTMSTAKIAVITTAYKFQSNPCPATFQAWLEAHAFLNQCMTLNLSDQRRFSEKLMHPTVRAPEPAPPRIRYVCPTSLEWQTSPAIGRNPADLCEFGPKPSLTVKLPAKAATVAKSVTTLTVYERTPYTVEVESVKVAHMMALDLKDVSFMICVDEVAVYFYSASGGKVDL